MSKNPDDWWSIEPHYHNDNPDGWVVYHHSTYPDTSVLAGYPSRQWVRHYPTLAEAQAEYPVAEVLDYSTKEPPPILPHVAPDWFDPDAAGERWDDDY